MAVGIVEEDPHIPIFHLLKGNYIHVYAEHLGRMLANMGCSKRYL